MLSMPVAGAQAMPIAATCPPTGDTAPDAFWSVMETDWGQRPFGAPVLHRGVRLLGRAQLACQGKFRAWHHIK